MNRHPRLASIALVAGMLMLSACGQNAAPAENVSEGTAVTNPSNEASQNTEPADEADAAADQGAEDEDSQILVVLDQTEMPIESGGLTFSFKKIPQGYALREMQWHGEGDPVITTYEQARENGASGGDGFYISGDGQFSGFLYPNEQKGEQGEISFVFSNDAGQEATWSKEITLQ
ncbi:hypothetical protein [Saccharibacillus sacchari]|uniref:hypothetical protein n=1 Tax=Saccharibacillus sacchari TaxID=456493 RepID=UPI0005676B3B|nr:hypothetical protein [Saccharibacillus sacchari]